MGMTYDPLAPASVLSPSSDWTPGARPANTFRGARRNAKKAKRSGDPFGRDPRLMEDFRNFMEVVWEFLGLPEPSDVQNSLAYWLQHGPSHAVILGFRGMAKSWITGTYALWRLYCNPQEKILIVSASLGRAVQTAQWMLALIREMPELQFLMPGPLQRSAGVNFDVGPATPDQSPSVRAAGINGQLAGSRAHLIVPDDIEIPNNSMTTMMREKIGEAVKEFDAILHPGGHIKYLGTPQCEDSLYPKLTKRGYTMRIWPARFPDKKMVAKYGDRLAPYILQRLQADPTLVGKSVWPTRFSDEDLARRELSYGRSGFALQFMLDTSLSDADRYPLKLRDLITDALDFIKGPDVIAWGNDSKLLYNDLPVMGFDGDHFYAPANKGDSYSNYNSIVAWVDPSGRGGDETALAILAELHGRLFLLYVGGWREGYSPETLGGIAAKLVQFRVHKLLIEDNFGDGMFTALIQPYIIKAWNDANSKAPPDRHGGTDVESIKSSKMQKELRILSVLEPATQQHRLVISKEVVEQDYASVQRYADLIGQEQVHHYSLIHQMTHLTRERDSLLHDDRLEAVAGVVSQFSDILGINPFESARDKEALRLEEELERLFEEADEVGQPPTSQGAQRWDRAKYPVRPN